MTTSDHNHQGILKNYEEPHRHYHNLEHVRDSLIKAYEILTDPRYENRGSDYIIFNALFYHDVIYDPGADDNEQRSADAMREHFMKDPEVSPESIENMHRIIVNTKHHSNPQSLEEAIVFDADLSILASDPERYREYLAQIRQEYSVFTDKEFSEGRLTFIDDTLNQEFIYHTDYAREHWEDTARENLREEKDFLLSSTGT